MCNCSNFNAWKELGQAPGCSFFLPPPGTEEEKSSHEYYETNDYFEAERIRFCEEHKPEGGIPFTGMW